MINKNEFPSYDELQNFIEHDETDSNFKTAANFLLSAVTDYPTLNLKEPIDLIVALQQSVGDKLTFDNLDKYSKSLSVIKDPWTVEAISSLLKMFDFGQRNIFDRTIELEVIIKEMTQHYRQ